MKLYIPSAKHNAINKRVIIPPNEVVYFSFDLYLNVYETPKQSNDLINSFIDSIKTNLLKIKII